MSFGDFSLQVLERLPSPVWVVDAGGEIAFANMAAAAELGWSDPGSLLGMPSHETVHHCHVDGSDYSRDECMVLRNGIPVQYTPDSDEWFVRRDGSMFPISWSCAPIDMPSGPGMVVAFSDISRERRRRDAAREAEVSRPAADRDVLVNRLRSYVIENATDPALDPAAIARAHHISLRLLQSVFADAGSSPARFIRDQRLMHARRLLTGGESISRVGSLSGFPDPGTFTRAFRRRFGCTPTAFQNGYRSLP